MKSILRLFSVAAVALASAVASYAVKVGDAAPAFTLSDCTGKSVSLADFKGKTVVLEWFNSACPFVVKHYVHGDMQKLQKQFADKGVVWLLVNSTNPKHQDFLDAAAQHKKCQDWKIAATHTLLDPTGEVGKAYDARTTPHMYIVNAEGVVVYNGAIDSIRSTKAEDVAKADNFVVAALSEVLEGKAVTNASTRPYGCSVKYP
jgi:peroxiredoxin